MMKTSVYILIASFLALFCSCDDRRPKHVVENFYLVDLDYDAAERCLSFKTETGGFVGIVDPTVLAYSLYGKYILVEQNIKPIVGKAVDSKLSYSIVDTEVNNLRMPEEGVMGPYDFNEFNSVCKRLKIKTPVSFIKAR